MTGPDPLGFRTYDPFGNLIAHGATAAEALAPLPDSKSRNEFFVRIDAAAAAIDQQLEQQQGHAEQLQQRQVRALCDGMAAIGRRLDAVEASRTERARQAAEDEARRIQQKLDQMPDPDSPDAPVTSEPTGELHQVAPSTAGARDQGTLPNEIVRKAPPTLGTMPMVDPADLDRPPDPRPPVAISLMSEL